MQLLLIPVLFMFVVASVFKIIISKAGTGKNKEWELNELINEDRASNFSRKKDIPAEAFRRPNIESLPIKEYPENDDAFISIKIIQEDVLKKANRKMILLTPPLTNIEIKKKYGAGNLDFIIQYEENYYSYINSLNTFAQSLIRLKDFDSAIKVFEHCIIDMESDIFKTYDLMCTVCEDTNEKDKLIQILSHIDNIETLKYNEELKYKIKTRLKQAINSL